MRLLVAAVLAAAALGVGGCDAAPVPAPPAGASPADPLAGVDAQLDGIERGLDADATG